MNVAIAGMGLIGGSFFKASQCAGFDVRGFDKGDVVDVADADIIIVALAPETAVIWIRSNQQRFKKGAVVVDTCGIKGPICKALAEDADSRDWIFVGGHPMAGKEVSGFANSDADLFKGASMILTPFPNTAPDILNMLNEYFLAIGFARTTITDPIHHDTMIAFTSQLCHIISSAYVRENLAKDHDGFSAGSFRDMIRVGAPDPVLWAELFISNREALIPVLDRFIGRLNNFRSAIANCDEKSIRNQLAEGSVAKKVLNIRNGH